MTPRRQFQPPRQSVIYAHTRRMLDQTAMDATAFALRVAEQYIATTAPDVRQVKLRLGDGADLLTAMDNNGQVLRRYMDGTVKVLPADLEDAWLLAMPEPYRGDCERDLARRRGYVPVQLGATGDAPCEPVCLGRLAKEFGALCEALAPALADGKFCHADMPHAARILNESDDLIAAVLALRRKVTAIMPRGSEPDA
jgi:hypothetical protein